MENRSKETGVAHRLALAKSFAIPVMDNADVITVAQGSVRILKGVELRQRLLTSDRSLRRNRC